MKKNTVGSGFFTVDRRTWGEVCNLGMNEAVGYLVMAQGSSGGNRATSWSSTALHKYTGITFDRGKSAIQHMVKAGFFRYAEGHSTAKPRYEIATWAEIAQPLHEGKLRELTHNQKYYLDAVKNKTIGRLNKAKELELENLAEMGLILKKDSYPPAFSIAVPDVSVEPEPIWLPNTLVTGTSAGEESPIKRLRRSGDLWALRLLVDLYHAQNLRDDGGIDPKVLKQQFLRLQIGQQGKFIVWAFKSDDRILNWLGPFGPHKRRPKVGKDHPVWSSINCLEQNGLVSFVPHVWDNEPPDGEVIHPYGVEGSGAEEIEIRIGRAALQAAREMALESRVEKGMIAGYLHLVPCYTTIPNCTLIGVPRLKYRPHTKRTSAWFADLQQKGSQFISMYNKISGLEEAGCIKGDQSTSRGFNGFQGSSKGVKQTA